MKNIIGVICIIGITAAVFFPAEAAGRRIPREQMLAEMAMVTPQDTVMVLTSPLLPLPNHPSELSFDSLNWKIPVGCPYRTQLANGIVAYVAVDSSLPLVNIGVYIRSGSLNDPEGKEGLGALTSRLMRTGGTEMYPADTLDALIDLHAMRFSFSQGESHITFDASFLYEYADTAMNIMQQMFFHPTFEQDKIDSERSIMTEHIRNRFTNPGPTLSFAYRKHKYTGNAPARTATETSVTAISREDIIALHTAAFGPSTEMIIAASGKFARDDMIDKLNAIFPILETPRKIVTFSEMFPEVTIKPQTRAFVVHRDINQAYVRMGLPLFRRPHPDFYAVSILNYILGGGGFNSRLVTRIRSDEGLTYSIHSVAESNYVYSGTIYVDFFTKTESYPQAVSIILEELDKIIKGGITEAELEDARTALIAQLPSSFRSPEDIVYTYASNEFFGRAPNHFVIYPDELKKLTTDDLQNAARKYINIDKITYTVVGDTAAIRAAEAAGKSFTLESLGGKLVTTMDSLVLMR